MHFLIWFPHEQRSRTLGSQITHTTKPKRPASAAGRDAAVARAMEGFEDDAGALPCDFTGGGSTIGVSSR